MSDAYCQPVSNVIDAVNRQRGGAQVTFLDHRGFLDGSHGPGWCVQYCPNHLHIASPSYQLVPALLFRMLQGIDSLSEFLDC